MEVNINAANIAAQQPALPNGGAALLKDGAALLKEGATVLKEGANAPNAPNAPQQLSQALAEALKSAGLDFSPENVKMLEELLKNNMALSTENIVKLRQALKATGDDLPQAMFLLKNDMPPTKANVEALRAELFNKQPTTEAEAETTAKLPIAQQVAQPDQPAQQGSAAQQGRQWQSAQQVAQQPATAQSPQVAQNAQQPATAQQSATSAAAGATANAAATQDTRVTALIDRLADAWEAMPEGAAKEAAAKILTETAPKQPETAARQNQPTQTKAATAEADEAITPKQPDKQPTEATKQPPKQPENATTKPQAAQPKPEAALTEIPLKSAEATEPKSAAKPEARQENAQSATREATNAPTDKHAPLAQTNANERTLIAADKRVTADDIREAVTRKFAANVSRVAGTTNATAGGKTQNAPDELDDALNMAKNAAERLKASLPDSPEARRLIETATQLSQRLDFADNVKTPVFVHFPFNVEGDRRDAEVYVFTDKRKKSRGEGGGSTALVALDLAALGRVEVYCSKHGGKVNCDFRLGDFEKRETFTSEMYRLENALADKGFTLEGATFRTLDEPFKLTDDEPGAGGEKRLYSLSERSIVDVKA